MVTDGLAYLFIPRDAGFFSVFNFLIGCLHDNIKVYPYYNTCLFLQHNTTNQHFCYFDNRKYNSWFSYFAPLSSEHEEDDILGLPVTQGELAPSEFRFPEKTRALYKSERFKEWREKVHVTYLRYIKPVPVIEDRVRILMKDVGHNAVGVLYRHPAHNCELDRPVLLEDYFKNIDKLDSNAKIFLVTDNDFGLCAFQQRYGERLVYDKQTGRTSHDNIIKWALARGSGMIDSLGFVNNVGYEYHNECCQNKIDQVEHGIMIISNTICLSMCKWFLYQESNISLAVSYMNPEVEMISVS